MTAPDGTPTTMITLFMNMLFKVIDERQPDCVIAVFDSGKKTFRHDLLPGYKADRETSPDDFRIQIPILQKLLNFLGYRVIQKDGIEADDIAASITKLAKLEGHKILILSSDKDLFQILSENVEMLRPIHQGISHAEDYNIEHFKKEYGFMPSSMPDFLAITGDSIDNIQGIAGMGGVRAKKILSEFPTLEKIFENLNDYPDKTIKNRLLASGSQRPIWIRDNIVRLKDDIFDDDKNFLNDCLNFSPDVEEAKNLAEKLGLQRVLKRLGADYVPSGTLYHLPASEETESPLAQQVDREIEIPNFDILAYDYKTELRNSPEKFTASKSIWDLKTAYYLLHPDETERNFPKILQDVSNENFNEVYKNLESEILRFDGLHDVMTKIDIPLIPVLNKMEDHGIRIDTDKFAVIQDELQEKIFNLENEIFTLSGANINVNSPKQVAWLLFERLGFDPDKKTKGKTSFSTDANVLEKLSKLPDGKIPALILEHREISKMLSGFVIPLQKAGETDGIIHTTFEPALTGTGRLSSRDPNLQNIPAFGEWAEKIKSGLVPVNPENIFVSADYSQIELRILAYFSGEEKLIDAFNNNRDIHSETASWVFETAPEFVTPELRRAAKMINFGLIYGMSSFGLADRLGISRTEAKEIMNRYFNALPGIQKFLDEIVENSKLLGFSHTLDGRIRPVKEIPAQGTGLERALINSPIQGTAADIARKAMINFESKVKGKLFLQVHDSLVCECKNSEADEISEILSTIMKESGGEIKNLEVQVKKSNSLNNV